MYELTSKRGRIKVDLKAFIIGHDLCVIVSGGDAPHIGSVTVSIPRSSLADSNDNSATTSVLNMLGHKDDEAARYVSHTLSAKLNKRIRSFNVEEASLEEVFLSLTGKKLRD